MAFPRRSLAVYIKMKRFAALELGDKTLRETLRKVEIRSIVLGFEVGFFANGYITGFGSWFFDFGNWKCGFGDLVGFCLGIVSWVVFG